MNTDLKSSEQVKAKFIGIFTPFIHQMSDKLVTSMNDVLKQANTKFKPQKCAEKFKTDMLEKWIDEFDTMWETKKLNERLTTLNALKQQYRQNGAIEKAWRAHGHTAEQQTQLSRNREMATYLHKMQELLEQQSTDLQKLIFEVEERRTYFNEVSKRRRKVLDEIDSRVDHLRSELDGTESETE